MSKKFFVWFENSYFPYIIWVFAFFSFSLAYNFCRDTDLLWHIKIGEEIFRSGSVLLADTFSWQNGLVWYQQEWLFDCFIYLVSLMPDLFFEALFVVNSSLMILVGMWYSKPVNKMCYMIFAIFFFAFIPATHGNRPSEFSIWIVLAVLFILMNSMSVLKNSILAFASGVLIANFHAACILPLFGFGVLLMLAEIVLCLRKIGDRGRLCKIPLFYIFFVFGTFICPCGPSLYSHLMAVTGTQTTRYIGEWVPWEPGVIGFFIIVISLASLFFSFPLIWNDAKRFRSLVVWLGALGLTFMYGGKGGVFLFLLSLFILYPYVEILLGYCIPAFESSLRVYVFVSFFFVSMGYMCIFGSVTYVPFYVWADNYIPENIVDILKAGSCEQGDDFRVFNSYIAGNFLIWNDIPCFIDSRQMPYVSEIANGGSVDDYCNLLHTDGFSLELYDDFFDKYMFTYILETEELELSEYLSLRGDYECMVATESSQVRLWKLKRSN